MNPRELTRWAIVIAVAGLAAVGCQPQPDVTVNPTPSSTTIVHDKTPSSPNVIVTPPAPSTHTDTHTNTNTTSPPDTTATSTTTTTTGG